MGEATGLTQIVQPDSSETEDVTPVGAATTVRKPPVEQPPPGTEPVPQPATAATTVDVVAAESSDAATADDQPHFWLRRSDQLVLGVLMIAVIGLMAAHWARLSGWGLQPVEIDRFEPRTYEYKLDVNQATWVEWLQLAGIGDTLARRIVANREEHGPFRSIDDLARVKGIGPKTVEKLRPWVTVNPSPASGGRQPAGSSR